MEIPSELLGPDFASGLEHKYHYEIIGHSGESHKITFVGPGSVTDAGSSDGMPRTRGDRLAVVQEMYSREYRYCVVTDFMRWPLQRTHPSGHLCRVTCARVPMHRCILLHERGPHPRCSNFCSRRRHEGTWGERTNLGRLSLNSGCATITDGHPVCLSMLLGQDDYYVFMLSDANLAMYGVSPKSLATALMSDPMVNSYAIFIAGEAAAEALKQEMPVGHARTCWSHVHV